MKIRVLYVSIIINIKKIGEMLKLLERGTNMQNNKVKKYVKTVSLNKEQSIKKGAMFGLDARIALAIFGALSVISGAALYSAIQDAKMTSMYTSLKEIEKAIEHFYLETGYKEFANIYDIHRLLENPSSDAVSGWNGPYISGELYKIGATTINDSILNSNLGLVATSGRPVNLPAMFNIACEASANSSSMNIYIQIDENKDTTICNGDMTYLKSFHDKFDGDGDYTKGKLRVVAHSSDSTKGSLFYRIDLLAKRD
jgi:type II secretory pathway pseudopilin PulG